MVKLLPGGRAVALAVLGGMTWLPAALGQEDVADVPSVRLTVGDDARKAYFLIGVKEPAEGEAKVVEPAGGFGLIVIMPGGDGSDEFHPFVKRLYQNSVPAGYLAVQPIAAPFTKMQEIVWPTEMSKVNGKKFSTEQFVREVIGEVKKKYAVNPAKVFTLTWSSSGPAAYAISLTKECGVVGSFVAMSVFKPDQLPGLEAAKDHAYFLYHSPEDNVCPVRMAEEARDKLTAAGAKVEFKTYPGGHGWKGNLYGDVRRGIEWLEKNVKAPVVKPEAAQAVEGK